MHDLRRCGLLAVAAARFSSQPDMEKLITPALESLSHSRRERAGVRFMKNTPESCRGVRDFWSTGTPFGRSSMIQNEFAAVEEGPEHVGQGIVFRARRLTVVRLLVNDFSDRLGKGQGGHLVRSAVVDISGQPLQLVRPRLAGQCAQEER